MAQGSPLSCRGSPVGTQQRVGLLHQGGQWLVGFGLAVQVLGHFRLAVQVIQLGAQRLRVGHGIVANHHTRGFDQTGLNGVVQAKI